MTNMIGEAWRAGKSFVTGLNITFKEMVFRPAITVFYPDELDTVPAWFRGIPLMKTDLLTGEYNCTSCGLCVEACPVNVITLEWHQDPTTKKKVADRYAIDMSRCMLCNYCIEACPFDALVMGMDYELCKVDPENMVYEFEYLLRLGLKYSSVAQPGPKAKKGALPPWVFHELTGATEEDIQDEAGFLGRAPQAKGYTPVLKAQYRKEETVVDQPPAPAPAKAEAKVAVAPAATPGMVPPDQPPANPGGTESGNKDGEEAE